MACSRLLLRHDRTLVGLKPFPTKHTYYCAEADLRKTEHAPDEFGYESWWFLAGEKGEGDAKSNEKNSPACRC
ncbi:MAG TPA: hypothetical protein VEX86_19640 [Longimicrobium sp.]|nr:hypothetical protein [Longimicrobium sp.]